MSHSRTQALPAGWAARSLGAQYAEGGQTTGSGRRVSGPPKTTWLPLWQPEGIPERWHRFSNLREELLLD